MKIRLHPDAMQRGMTRFPKRSFLARLRNALLRIPFRPLDINCLYFLEYAGIPPRAKAWARSRCEVRSASLDDLQGITKCQNTPEAFVKRFQSKDHCVVAIVGGQIIGYEWFCDKLFHLEERYSYKIEIPQDAIYAYDAFILPWHRLSGVWLKFKVVYLSELMQTLHKKKILTMIDSGNRISMNTHLRFGFRPIRMVLVFKLFGKSFFITRSIGLEGPASLPVPTVETLERRRRKESWSSKSVTSWTN